MSVCLTMDLHHDSLRTDDQLACPISEIEVAGLFVELLEERSICATAFVTGRAVEEEWDTLAPIARHPLIELGGHTYDAFERDWLHRLCLHALGSYPGTVAMERRSIRRTVDAIVERTGQRITLWRNHMYMGGRNTHALLASEGFRLVSDGVQRSAEGPVRTASGVLSFPLNVVPDHEHLLHANRTPEEVCRWARECRFADDFGAVSWGAPEWARRAVACIDDNERRGVVSNVLIHPICMYLADGFDAVRTVLDRISSAGSVHLSTTTPRALS